MDFDTSSPFIQELISQGQTNGYGPMAIGALASRALAENGGMTSGTPGDNGTAFGGMQWRNDRVPGLYALANQMGSTWDDPKVQAAYVYQELGGPEQRAGKALMSAQDPTSAANAVMGYVRPAGYSQGAPQNGAAYGQTLDGTNAIGQAIATGKAPTGLMEGRSASLDSTPTASISPAVAASAGAYGGGSGGIPISLGTQIQNAGAALMARDNPMGAMQLAGLAKQGEQMDMLQSGLGQWEDKGVSPNGQYQMQTNKYTGQMRYLPMPAAATGLNAKQMVPSPKEEAQFQDNDNQMAKNAQVIDAANLLRQHIVNGDLSMTWDKQAGAYVANYLGHSTPESVDIKNAQAVINQQVGNIVAAEKGVGTKTKLQQAMGQLVPAGGQYDPVTFLDALDRTVKLGTGIYGSAANYNSHLLSTKPTLGQGAFDASGNPTDATGLQKMYGSNIARWNQANQDIEGKAADFRKAHFAASAGTTTSPPSFGSFLSTYKPQNQ